MTAASAPKPGHSSQNATMLIALQQALLMTLVMCVVTAMTLDWDSAAARPRLRDRVGLAAVVLAVLLPGLVAGCGLMAWAIAAPWWFSLLLVWGVSGGAAVLVMLAVSIMYVSEWLLYGLRVRCRNSR